MKIGDLLSVLETFAPLSLQEDWDNAGLIVGNRGTECTGVLCALDSTPEVVQEAVAKGCNLVVAHHPIVFRGLKKLNGGNYVERTVIAAIQNNVALYASHTNLDNVLLGVNNALADKLNLGNRRILQPKTGTLRKLVTYAPTDKASGVRAALFAAGAGHIGNYAECSFNSEGTGTFKALAGTNPYVGEQGKQHHERETKIEVVFPFYNEWGVLQALRQSHPYEEVAYDVFPMQNENGTIGSGLIGDLEEAMEEEAFLRHLKETFGLQVIRHTAFRSRPVKTVAVCGGAGSFLIKKALHSGADAYVTADVKYHEFFDAEGEMLLADIGHYESEAAAVDLLHHLLASKFPTFAAVLKSGVNTNPVRYYR